MRFELSFCLIQRSPQLELDYFLCFRIKILSTKDIVKLTIAPRVARIIVLSTSSECKFGKTLKNVPPAVPITVELLCSINFFGCQLANSRQNTASNCQIATDSSYYNWQSNWRSQNSSANGSQCQTNISKHFKKFRVGALARLIRFIFYHFYHSHLSFPFRWESTINSTLSSLSKAL